MVRQKLKKICAGVLVASMLLQTLPAQVQAEEKVNTTITASEGQQDTQTPNGSATQSNGTTSENESGKNDSNETGTEQPDDASENNSKSEAEENQQENESDKSDSNIEESAQENTKQTDAEQEATADEANPTDATGNGIQVVDNKVTLKCTADFINLSHMDAQAYQTATITIQRETTTPFDLTQTVDGKTFRGFGSEQYPFKGTIAITSSGSGIDIPINHSFFNYLDQSATINEGLYLKAKGTVDVPLLATNYVNDGNLAVAEPKQISLMIGAEKEDNNLPSFGGIIGTMDSNTNLSLSVVNKITEANTTITGTGNLGFFCNTMEASANLTIASYTDGNSTNSGSTGSGTATIGYDISTTGGHAGGLVGEMQNGSILTVNQALSLTGNVTTTVTGFAAGGLIGAVTNPTITLNNSVTRKGTIEGTSESGGFIGKAVYNYNRTDNTELELDLSNINVSGITISNGNHAGGYFGVLNFDSTAGGAITIKNVPETKLTHTGTSWQFGGVIGQYSANSQSSTLRMESPNVTISSNGTVTALGGIIGSVAGNGADHALNNELKKVTSAYVEICNATIAANLTTDLTTDGYFGGLVGELGQAEGQGHFLSVSGTTKVSGSDNGKANKLGGILGKSTKGILRISGTTDLSELTIGRTGTECGQIAGSIDGTTVYALGSGKGTGGNGYDWKYIRPKAVPVSDIGSYGEVIRLDGNKLKETDGSSADDTTLFTNSASHQFSVAYKPEETLTIKNTRDLAAVAVLLQQGNDLLNKNITVNCDVDLTGIGIYSLLRDNGKQEYTGTFDGNGHTITLAAGEAYGYLSDGTTLAENADGVSATVGIGQIYNHSTIGFIPYCNGTVQNLKLNGSIYFQNLSYGVDVRCGAIAGYTDGATFENVTVDTKIVYRDGAGGNGLSVISIGGFLGRAKGTGTTTFTDCSMQGTISSSSGCYDFAIGGYVAAGEEGANITFSNCGISNATIKHEKFKDNSNAPNALFGGLIGYMTGNVTINGLTINKLQMESYATETAGGLLGYYWRKNSATDSVSINNLVVQDSTLNVKGKFGGLVYSTDAYWKIGDGTDENGIKFSASNSFSGKTEEANPSALLVCSTIRSEKEKDKAYIEIRKDGLKIEKDAVNVTLDGGNYFDDIAGKTKYGEDGNNAVVSIGLTSPDATTATLIDQDKDKCNTWTNQCNVNSGTSYTNKNTRYYYNVDYYRVKDGTDTNITEIDSAGKLLLRSLYVYVQPNLQQYFIKGSDDFYLTGNIDLTGVSYYPMSRAITIQGATVIFGYTNMNTNTEKKYSDSSQQHYQMQTGLFSKISQKFTVNGLTLQGTFGKYENNKAGVLICDSIAQEDTNKDQAVIPITITNLTLDGIQCKDGTDLPLLVNSVGSNTAISMNDVTFTRGAYTTLGLNKVASALMGKVGSSTAQKISLEFSNMDLNRAGNDSIFKTAIFATAFQYGDGASGGSYNFESTTKKITFGKEISNGVSGTVSGRNSYNKDNVTGQVWYLDTFGNTTAGSYVGADKAAIKTGNETGNKPANSPQDFSGYLPYIGKPENSANKDYELDINQKAVYLVDGCGTYGHPWVIQDVSREGGVQTLFTGEDQMMTVMKLLDDTGRNGTAIKINTEILNTKMAGQSVEIKVHTDQTGDASADMVFIKNGNTWVEATRAGNRYVQKTDSNATLTNEQVMAYLRNGYFQIKKDLTLNVAQFTGFGKNDVSRAFSGVIVGDTADRKITLTGENTTGEVGGLIRYSQGSVVKNLTIVLDKVTFNGNSTETFFGGVIGWVIGGDNIIDNVILTVNSVNKGSSAKNLTAVGGYVGMVGGYVKTVGSTTIDQSKKGGGVVFRNISSAGLTSISGTATNTEGAGNTNYYWNPYVGRVFDGYACAEESCSGMGTNTDKNYTIPKLDKDVKLKITGDGKSVITVDDKNKVTAYSKSTITLDSTQSIWLLSAIVNSGFGAKTAGGDFALTSSNGTDYKVNASYYGRTRTGTYDGVGTTSNQADATDENDYWGGKLIKDGKEVDRRKHSTSYLSTYVKTQDNVDAKAVTYSLTMDNNGRSVTFVNGTYDLSSYGNGFRGIGHNYGSPADIRKSRALRLQNNGSIAVAGNGATITYIRKIYEMSSNDISVTQAGFFTQCLANSSAIYTVNGLNFKDVTLKKNIGKDGVALGVAFARDGAYSPESLTFDGVIVTNSAIDQADQGAAVIGYMSNLTKNIMITFTGCRVDGFTAGAENSTNKMNHCGAFIGKADSPAKGATSTDRKVEFENCTANNIKLYNVQNGGLFAGYVNGTCTINGGSADTGTITSRTAVGGGYSMGGLIGKAESTLNIEGTTETPVPVNNISIRETKDVNSTSKSYAGGVAGSAALTNIQNVDVENVRLAGKDLGGLIGCVNDSADVKNIKISNSYLANCSQSTDQRAVGGFFGIINGTFNGFNLLSKDNVIGYAVEDNKLLSSVSSEALSNLSPDSIGLLLNVGLLLNDSTYATYSSLAANATLQSGTPCGIWVGNANYKPVNIVSASRQGNYSAVNNIGAGKNESSYVIYADYTGQSTTSSTVNTKPEAIVTAGGTPLTGDGATKVNGTAVRDSIISDIMTNPSLMKGYYGGDQSRPLDEIVKKFGTNGDYSSRLSNYQKEDTSYKSDDFPILVLNATTKSELNSIVNNYISMLTNTKQEQSKRYYVSIEPQTYKYEDNAWNLVSAENQTMSWNSTDGVSINRGKYDNNKQQITILDVSYEIEVKGSKEVYHLYIPVLVKKLMDVECSVKVVNGAAGYDPATDGNATLNSFGENYTAHISYTYKWMVSEWQSMLENGDSLLWNFDKTVKLGSFGTLDPSKIHLTLVDMNTQGTQTSYHQNTLQELSTDGVLTDDTLNLAEMAKQGKSPYICDLLPLKATESATGGFKKVESTDSGAVLRIWDNTENTFIYYAAKSDADAKDIKYYNVTLNTTCGLNDILPVTEEYYLVMNCTEGNATTPMLNTTLELNQSYSNQQIPTKVTGNFNVVYLLGDFYKLDNVTLKSESTTQNQEMVSGSNDSIKVTVSSKVSAAANENEFGSYVNDRSIYYQYSLQTVNQSGNPVDMKGAASIPTLKLEKKNADGTVTETHELKQLTNLSGTENGFVTQFGENGYIITIKAPGEWYTGATITAGMSFSYNSTEMNQQFPVRKSNTENTGVKFKADAVMAYQQDSLGSSGISASATEEKLYYQLKEAQAKLSYDSYNITSKDGNTSQLGINGRENDNAAMEISSRALLDVTDFSSFNLTDESNSAYPYYLEGELTLAKKTDSGNGTNYQNVAIGKYLSDFVIESAGTKVNVDVTSEGLGLQENNTVYKFRIQLTQNQVSKILDTPLLVNIKYKVKTGKELENITGGQYANYKVTLSATLKNRNLKDLLNVKPSDYLIYTNAKVYLKIVG